MSARSEKLRLARGYISRSWPTFVLSSSKTPVANCDRCRAEHTMPAQMEACSCLTCHGFYSATLDLDRVAEMIRLHPKGLLAIRTGAPSGTVVIDVDAPHGIPTMRQLITDGMLPRTVVQRTGSDGYHLLYRHPGVRIPSGAGKGGTGVDIKADGGYIVVAPSVHPRTRQPYAWLAPFTGELSPLPGEWVERLREPQRPPRPAGGPPPLLGVTGNRYAMGALRRQLGSLLDAPEGTRNDTLNRSAFALGQLVGAGMLDGDSTAAALEDAAQRIGLDPGEVRRSVASGLRAGARRPRGGAA